MIYSHVRPQSNLHAIYIMSLTIPQLELSPGRIICLHIPHGFHEEFSALEQEVLRAAWREDKSTAVCCPARNRRGCREYFRRQRTAEWLSQAAGIMEQEAAELIASFDVRVADILSANALTPRCLLGIAAALCKRPEVVIYSTCGLDPSGRLAVHRFVSLNSGALCAVHLSSPTVFGNGSPAPRICPDKSRCITLAADSVGGVDG